MAKSIRSKRMRKLRAFKRIRYGEKELARLKNMLEKVEAEKKIISLMLIKKVIDIVYDTKYLLILKSIM